MSHYRIGGSATSMGASALFFGKSIHYWVDRGLLNVLPNIRPRSSILCRRHNAGGYLPSEKAMPYLVDGSIDFYLLLLYVVDDLLLLFEHDLRHEAVLAKL
jgi:hypothetical protein